MQDKKGWGNILRKAAQNLIQQNLHDNNCYIANML